jgi:hypothetical protein
LANKNRTVVKDGRLQVKPKRTDRSYLQPSPTPQAPEAVTDPEPGEVPAVTTEPATDAAAASAPEAAARTPDDAAAAATLSPPPPAPAPAAPTAAVAATGAAPATGAARALQQQGVRKRREVDLNELARRDSSYAMHELRRIAILTVIVVVSLVVLAVVLR